MKVIKILFALIVGNSAMLIASEPQFINKLKIDAIAGNATAQCNLGVSYMEVARSQKDYAEAVKWFRKAAEQGNAKARTNLGLAYLFGQGVKENKIEAAKLFRIAAEQDNPTAQLYLGIGCLLGESIPQNSAEAVKWIRKSANQSIKSQFPGFAEAQTMLGLCYKSGCEVPKKRLPGSKVVSQGSRCRKC